LQGPSQGIWRQDKRTRHKIAPTSGRQKDIQKDPLANEYQDTVEEPAPSQMKEETTNSLYTRAVGALATFERSAPKKMEPEA
jgi:hypothetical protein